MSKQSLNEVFKEETSEKLLNKIAGGLSKAQCKQYWAACQLEQTLPCGTRTSSCTIYKKYCR